MAFNYTPNNPYRNTPYASPFGVDLPADQSLLPTSGPLPTGTRGQPGLTTQPQQGGGGGFQSMLNTLGSPGGQALTNMVGSGLQAYGNYQSNQQQMKQNASQFAAQTLQNQYNQDQNRKQQGAQGVVNGDPLGASQGFAQKQALMSAILPNLRNVRSQPGDAGVAGAMGGNRGGMMSALPEGGLDPSMINQLYGKDATQASLVKRQNELTNLDSRAPQTDLGSLFGSQEAAPYQAQIKDWASQLQQKEGAEKQAFEQQLNQHIQQMAADEQKSGKSGFWHKFAQIAGVVGAGVATIMTAGAASPLMIAASTALGAGSGMASAWGSGGSPLMGAIAGGAGAASSRAPIGGMSAGNVARTTALNPALYGAILNRG